MSDIKVPKDLRQELNTIRLFFRYLEQEPTQALLLRCAQRNSSNDEGRKEFNDALAGLQTVNTATTDNELLQDIIQVGPYFSSMVAWAVLSYEDRSTLPEDAIPSFQATEAAKKAYHKWVRNS